MKFQLWRHRLRRFGWEALPVVARIFPGVVFWQSGQTKLDGWQLSSDALYLFQEEYRLPLLDPSLAAGLAATAEHVLPLLILLGLGTRLAATGLLLMTLVIQLLVYPDAWPTHGTWAVGLLVLITQGAGRWSVDGWLWKRHGAGGTAHENSCIEHADPESCLGGPK